MPQIDGGTQYHVVRRLQLELLNKRAIDLELIHGQSFEVSER